MFWAEIWKISAVLSENFWVFEGEIFYIKFEQACFRNGTKWRGLIERGAGEYEAKRMSEAEQKRAQRKARAKASPTGLSSLDLLFYLQQAV